MSKIGDYITSPQFVKAAEKAVQDAITDLRAKGIEPVYAPLPDDSRKKTMIEDHWKAPEFMTSAELEAAVQEHRARTKKLLEEIRARREAEKKQRSQANDPDR